MSPSNGPSAINILGDGWKPIKPNKREMALLDALVAQNGTILAANERLIKILSASMLFIAHKGESDVQV